MANTKEIDILNRQGYVDQMKSILATLSENKKNCAFALNGEWGSGKTFVLNMLEEQIQNDYLVIRYNAWENDFYEEPLIAILYTFANKLNETNKIKNIANGTLKNIGKRVGNSILNVIGEITANKVGINAVELAKNTVKSIKDNKEQEQINIDFNPQANIKIIEEKIVKELNKLSDKVSIVVLVDELDRCLPEYAIKVLERLHHVLYEVKNLQVIISVDKKQLEATIKSIYGEKTNTNKYLEKFVDFEIELSIGKVNESVMTAYDFYFNNFEYKYQFTGQKDVNVFIKGLLNLMPARLKKQVVNKANIIHSIIVDKNDKCDFSFCCIELLLVYYSTEFEENFKNLLNKKIHDIFNSFLSTDDFKFIKDKLNETTHYGEPIRFDKFEDGSLHINLGDLWSLIWVSILSLYDAKNQVHYSFTAQMTAYNEPSYKVEETKKHVKKVFDCLQIIK